MLEYCAEEGIPLLRRAAILDQQVDLLISVLYPFVIEESYLGHASSGCFNLHEAPLPRWRGCNGVSHAILEGDAQYGTTLHELVLQLDGGRVVAERRFPISQFETARELYERTSEVSLLLAREWFPRLVRGEFSLSDQARCEESFLNQRNSLLKHKRLSPDTTITDAFRTARALDFVPWEPAFVTSRQTKFYLFIHGSAGRTEMDLSGAKPIRGCSNLGQVPWGSWTMGVIRDLGRPLIICHEEEYRKRFPLFGGLVNINGGTVSNE